MVARRFTDEQELDMCLAYEGGVPTTTIGEVWSCDKTVINRILRRRGVTIRTNGQALRISSKAAEHRKQMHQDRRLFTPEDEKTIIEQYLTGKTHQEIAAQWGCSKTAILNIRRRNNIEARQMGGFGDNLKDIIRGTGLHVTSRETELYVCPLFNYQDVLKVGISVDYNRRACESGGQYGDLLLLQVFGSRGEALAIEQAILHATRAAAVCPAELLNWHGASELRTTPLETIEELLAYYTDQLEELDLKEFIRAYWPMTAAEEELLDSWEPGRYNEEVPEEEGYGPS